MCAGLLLAVCGGCGDTSAPAPKKSDPWDDDSDRLGHCEFTPAPERDAQPAPQPSALSAGYGTAILELPIGTPLGAYGARVHALGMSDDPDERHARWATAMSVSVGMHDSARAEALALQTEGEAPLLLMRVDAPFVTENALFALEQALAPDGSLRGRILLSGSHSHSSWGGWLPTVHLAPGIDRPSRHLFERGIAALAKAAQMALDGLEPARIGVAIEDAFDPDDRVTRDRRETNDAILGPDGNDAGKNKDGQVWALRVDRASGEPLVALVDLPIHGTVGEPANPLMSSDAPGGVARAMSHALGYPVMHLQGVTGDLSPAGAGGRDACPDAVRCHDMPRLESIGARAADQMASLVMGIETGDRVTLELVTRTFPVGRGGVVERPDGRQLYYLPPDRDYYPDGILFDDDGKAASPFDEFNTMGGAGLCGESAGITFAPIPGSSNLGPYHACIDLDTGALTVLSLFDIEPPPLPICDSVRATGAALRLAGIPGGDVLLVGVPGEPTAPFAAYLRGRSPAPKERTLIIGYTDDYSGYMLTAEDWLSGGYECSTNIWGPREGEQILEQLLETAALAWTPELEDPEAGGDRFEAFTFPPGDAVAPVVTSDHGTPAPVDAALWWPDTLESVVLQSSVARAVGVARFAWRGGDPAVDYPSVIVEREVSADVWEPLRAADGRVASSHDGVVVISYTPAPLSAEEPSEHLYAASWQTTAVEPLVLADPIRPYALQLGRYRLCATGRALAAAGVEDYALCSTPFDVVAAGLSAASSASRQSDGIALNASVGPAPGLRALRDGVSDGLVPLPGPWTVTVTLDDTSTVVAEVVPAEGSGVMPLSAAEAAAAVSVEVADPAGNGGVLTVR